MADKEQNKLGILAASTIAGRNTSSDVRGFIKEYQRQSNVHEVNSLESDRIFRKEQYIAEERHKKEVEHQNKINELVDARIAAEKEGNKDLVQTINNEITVLRRKGADQVGFDVDELSKNFSATFEEIATNFSDLSIAEQKGTLKRIETLKEVIANSNAAEKDFLLEQADNLATSAQNEYNKRATIAARALEKGQELAEQYMDLSSLYAGFVDHNPVMMAAWRIGSDMIRRRRVQKKLERETLVRDLKNAERAEKDQKNKEIATKKEAERVDHLNALSDEAVKKQQAWAEEKKKAEKEVLTQQKEDVKKSKPVIERDKKEPTTFDVSLPDDEFSGTGDDAIDIGGLFAGIASDDDDDPVFTPSVDSGDGWVDHDPSGFERETPEPVVIDPSETIPVKEPLLVKVAEDTPEQKAQNLFLRQDREQAERAENEFRTLQSDHNEKIFSKLEDIETAILHGNKLEEKQTKELKGLGGGGILEALGLTRIASMFKGPILKALMLFAPAVTALGGVLTKFGLGGFADKLTGGFDDMVERTGGDRNARTNKRTGKKPGKFSRVASRAGGMMKTGASRAGGMLARGGGAALRMGGALLSSPAAAVAGAGAGGYMIGSLINDHMLSDDVKTSLGDFIGPKIDSILSLFGNDEAQSRLDGIERQKQVMTKEPTGAEFVVKADEINSTKMVNNQTVAVKGGESIEVPVQKETEQKLRMLEEKITEVQDAKDKQSAPPVIIPPKEPTKVNTVKSDAGGKIVDTGRSARNSDSSIQRLTDRFVGYGMA